MSILILIFATIACFGLLFFFRHYYDSMALISVAIGAAINANIYNSFNMPIEMGWVIFGIDSMLYSLFMFTVIWRAKDYSISSSKSLTLSTIIAIVISAAIELFAKWSHLGYLDWENGKTIIGYCVSAAATGITVWLVLFLFRFMEEHKQNTYLEFAVSLLVASTVHSLIYNGFMSLINWNIPEDALRHWVGAMIIRLICAAFGCLLYFLNTKFWKPRDIEIRFRGDSRDSE